ncbi:cell cycle control protein [Anaeramoeba ignava]|uniref:Cell cycle control protein n=1 Tax=Anaeramoeba ignava TaxID=1746090 RepID=A0A9Q0LJV2_ANAIG|nr:cell cycle control protein [Anaeramoeba ignava]|eukprot:Anaeramoba_ignava/a94531_48.p1 GENE.a94531_48~~a94531_48.p1  ORF type:complete len:302 (+),score=74.90 a94531_48:5-910(+)
MEHPNKPKNSAFKQQRLKAWQPILTPRPVITTFFIVGAVFVIIGVALTVSTNKVKESKIEYTDCPLNSTCTKSIEISDKLSSPVYMYYQLTNYHQNHRRYVKSRSDKQLRGEKVSFKDLEICKPRRSLDDSSSPDKIYIPCGLIAYSKFTDIFELGDGASNFTLSKGDIAWNSDVTKKFQNPNPFPVGIEIQRNFEDPDFVNWMRVAALPTFRKLYAKIDQDIEKGTYNLYINNTYEVSSFDGTKTIILTTTSWAGGKNIFLGSAYLALGSFIIGIGIFCLITHLVAPRKLADTTYLPWKS